jgi:PAS domain S-box-containing protein
MTAQSNRIPLVDEDPDDRDVTELREFQERTRLQAALLQCVGQPVCAVDDQSQITYWNGAIAELTGYSASEVMGSEVLKLIVSPESIDSALEAREAARAGRRWEGTLRVLRRSGGSAVLRATVTPAIKPDGTPGGRIAVCADITELLAAEEKQQESAERVRFQASLLDAVGQAVIATDIKGRVTYWNRAAEQLFGWKQEEAVSRPILEIVAAESSQHRGEEILEALGRGETWTGEFRVRRRDGTNFLALVTDAPILDESGSLIGIIGISSDITERVGLEEQLRQGQKMEAIGRLAGGVAHDFNNLLTAIKGHAGMLLEDLPQGSEHREDAFQIFQAGERAAALTRQLLAFSRKQVLEAQSVDLAAAALNLQPMLRRLIPERIDFRVDSDGEHAIVWADPGQLNQILMNLVVNAADAIEGTGTISIQLDSVDLSKADADAIPWHVEVGRYARMRVRDNGSGITPQVLSKIFEPFFTTKAEGAGTGLGLSTVYGIVKQSGGHIMVNSSPDIGTTFQVLLPLSETAPDAPVTTRRATRIAPPAGGVILLVEDDESVRCLARRILERAGYTVLQAPNGRAALELAASHGRTVDVVLSDVIMPDMGGVELKERLRAIYPALQVILTSGYSEADLRGEVRAKSAAFLRKPFTAASLLQVVAETMAGKPRPC